MKSNDLQIWIVVKIFGLEQYQNIFDGSSLRLILHMIKCLLNEAVS